MPSPRASPALRPSSPLSPRFDSGPRYESLQPPSPRAIHARSAGPPHMQMRHNTNSLKLPSLPRFHPANFPSSSQSSPANTPGSHNLGQPIPQPPVSPKAQQKIYSEAQKQLYLYHRETLAAQHAGRPTTSRYEKPVSPRLAPLGSPGPVTPLELEGHDGYLLAGAHAAAAHEKLTAQSTELVEKLIEQEVRRNADMNHSSQSSTLVGGR